MTTTCPRPNNVPDNMGTLCQRWLMVGSVGVAMAYLPMLGLDDKNGNWSQKLICGK